MSFKDDLMHRLSRKGGTVFLYGNAALVLAAFLIRFIVCCQLIRLDPAAANPSVITDMHTYLDLSRQILSGNWPQTFYYQPFYYAVFLPLSKLLWPSAYGIAFFQSLLGAFTVYFAGRAARMIGGKIAGLCSAALCCFTLLHVYFTAYALLEVLQCFWITLLIWLLLRLRRKPFALWRWGVWGIILGCSILTRGNTALFLIPGAMVLYSLRKKLPRKKLLFSALLMLFCTALPQMPFSIYNTIKQGHLSGPSTAGGAVLAFGNNPEGAPAGLEIPYPKTYELWLSREKLCSIPERMFQWFKEEPGAFLEQQFQKVMLFWDSMDYPNNITIENAKKSPLIQSLVLLPTGIILALALAGLFTGLYLRRYRKNRSFHLLLTFIVLYALSIAAFYILERFKLPAVGLLCMAGGLFLSELFRKNRSFAILVRIVLLGAIAGFVVYGFCPLYSMTYETLLAKTLRPYGVQTEFDSSPWQWAEAPPAGKYRMICDHSSILRGGWSGIGTQFEAQKTFLLPPGKKIRGQALLVLPAPGKEGGLAILSANGVYAAVPIKEGVIALPIPVRADAEGKITVNLSITQSRGDWSCVLDTRRDYGRTLINGKSVPGELAAFLVTALEQ